MAFPSKILHMRKTWLRSLLALVVAASFAEGMIAPASMHGCETTTSAVADMPSGHSSHAPAIPKSPKPCHCLGTACCASAPLPPAVPLVRLFEAVATDADLPQHVARIPVYSAADHLHPLAHAPPLLNIA